MAGAERLIYELCQFALHNNCKPSILIANNYNVEYYDSVFKALGIKVVRTTLTGTAKLRNPAKILYSLFWQLKLKHFAGLCFKSLHIIGLYNAKRNANTNHPNRVLWHVNNAVQYFDGTYDFDKEIFSNADDTIICINEHQLKELSAQYEGAIKCKIVLFKLFLADI